MVIWALIVSFVVGAVCAVRLPVLIFTLMVSLVAIVFAAISLHAGTSLASTAIWTLVYAAALEIGYVLAHGLLYFLYIKRSERASRQQPPLDLPSKYSSD